MQLFFSMFIFFLFQLVWGVFSISSMKEYVFHNKINMMDSANISAQEMSALQDLYVSTNGNEWNWRNASYGIPWNFTTNSNPCTENWQGVTCRLYPSSSTQHVIELSLSDYNLNGTIPTSLINLTELEQFLVSHNYLYGKLMYISFILMFIINTQLVINYCI